MVATRGSSEQNIQFSNLFFFWKTKVAFDSSRWLLQKLNWVKKFYFQSKISIFSKSLYTTGSVPFFWAAFRSNVDEIMSKLKDIGRISKERHFIFEYFSWDFEIIGQSDSCPFLFYLSQFESIASGQSLSLCLTDFVIDFNPQVWMKKSGHSLNITFCNSSIVKWGHILRTAEIKRSLIDKLSILYINYFRNFSF